MSHNDSGSLPGAEPSQSPSPSPQAPVRRRHGAWKVLGAVWTLSAILGVLAYRNYIHWDRYLHQSLDSMQVRGKELTFEQCVDEILEWVPKCVAMKKLCETSVPRVMDFCLAGRNRATECKQLGLSSTDAHFGFKECQAKQLGRSQNKNCGNAYRTMDSHCRRISRGG